jgi:hypothetical protein
MRSFEFALLSKPGRWAGVLFALVSALACLSAVLVVFASASGELDPVLARVQSAKAASAVAAKAPARPARG